ncbi:methyltransferase domain-containing protein [Couchioplanes caeruleus]|uniref:methyltransferase domain-containing protein n=1 Tax=Couchioplanes caeruleus TaxID=56438 RepID=UPI001FD093A4|nr:class I SAM-dependent methyltransferase [Couchioplanes caeruleus]
MFQPELVHTTAEVLAQLAGTGPALELGIGTGRVALPLARRGVPVHGIDLSRAMVARMRAKPGGDRIDVTNGPPVSRHRVAVGVRRLRPRHPGTDLELSVPLRRTGRTAQHPLPLRMARGARSHGPPRGPAAEAPLGRLGPCPLHRRQRSARLGLGKAALTHSVDGHNCTSTRPSTVS